MGHTDPMHRIPRQIRRHLREEGGAGSVSAEFGLMSTAVAASTVAAISGFGHFAETTLAESCEQIAQVVDSRSDTRSDARTDCPPDPPDLPRGP